jgi:hypothetical protein
LGLFGVVGLAGFFGQPVCFAFLVLLGLLALPSDSGPAKAPRWAVAVASSAALVVAVVVLALFLQP